MALRAGDTALNTYKSPAYFQPSLRDTLTASPEEEKLTRSRQAGNLANLRPLAFKLLGNGHSAKR
jgi:hypothetical protein